MKDSPTSFTESPEVVALFDIAGFTSAPPGLSPADLVDVLKKYLEVILPVVESSGGKAVHLNGNAVLAFWPTNPMPKAQERIGSAVVEVIAAVSAIILPGGLRCVPSVGLASGSMIHATLGISGRQFPISMGATQNLAMRLSSSCLFMKKRILFPKGIPIVWPTGTIVEEVGPITVKGMAEQLQLMSLEEKPG